MSSHSSPLSEDGNGHTVPASLSLSSAYVSSSSALLSSFRARHGAVSNGFSPGAHTQPLSVASLSEPSTQPRLRKDGEVAATVLSARSARASQSNGEDGDAHDNPESRRGRLIVNGSPSTRSSAADVEQRTGAQRTHATGGPGTAFAVSERRGGDGAIAAQRSSSPSSSFPLYSAPSAGLVPSLLRSLVVDALRRGRSPGSGSAVEPSSAQVESLRSYCLRLLSSRLAGGALSSTSSSSSLPSLMDAVQRDVQGSAPGDAVRAGELLQRFARSDAVREKAAVLQLLLACRGHGRALQRSRPSFSLGSTVLPLPKAPVAASWSTESQPPARQPPHRRGAQYEDDDDEEEDDRASASERYSVLPPRRRVVAGGGREPVAESISEEEVVRDVLFAFQGVNGRLLRFDAASLSFRPTAEAAALLSAPRQRLLARLCQLGALYRLVCHTVNGALEREQSSERGSGRPSHTASAAVHSPGEAVKVVGLMEQSFVGALQAELGDYLRWLSVLEAQFLQAPPALTLHRLLVAVHAPRTRLTLLASLCSSAAAMHGGALLSSLYLHFHNGEAQHGALMTTLLRASCAPLFRAIRQWIEHGDIHDPHREFFVAVDHSAPPARLWTDRYRLRPSMRPSFVSPALAAQILVIGKSVNFIRHCCHDDSWEAAAAVVDFNGLFAPSAASASTLERDVARCASLTHAHLLSLMLTQYRFLLHARALKSYLLLAQGDFIQYLLALLQPELPKPASTLNVRALTALVDQAVRASNARFEPAEVLQRLSVRLLRSTEGGGDSGWDVFSLDYHVEPPLSVVLTPPCMAVYLRLFAFLWRLKRVEWEVKEAWMRQSSHRFAIDRELRALSAYAGLGRLLSGGYALRQAMAHLLANVSSYLQFEVMESSWELLERDVRGAREMDDLITAHHRYVHHIAEKALLAGSAASLSALLLPLFDDILRFTRMQTQLYDEAVKEVTTRQTYSLAVTKQQRSTAGAGAGGSADSSRRGSLLQAEEQPRTRSASAAEVYVSTTEALLSSGVFVHELPRWQDEQDRLSAAFQQHLDTFLTALDAVIEKGQLNSKATAANGRPATAAEEATSDAASASASASASAAYIPELEFLRLRLDWNEFYLTRSSQRFAASTRSGEEEGRAQQTQTLPSSRGAMPPPSATPSAKTMSGRREGGDAGREPFSSGWSRGAAAGASGGGLPPRPRTASASSSRRMDAVDEIKHSG